MVTQLCDNGSGVEEGGEVKTKIKIIIAADVVEEQIRAKESNLLFSWHPHISIVLGTMTNLKCNSSRLHKSNGRSVARRTENPDDSTSYSRTVTSLPNAAFSKLESTRPE